MELTFKEAICKLLDGETLGVENATYTLYTYDEDPRMFRADYHDGEEHYLPFCKLPINGWCMPNKMTLQEFMVDMRNRGITVYVDEYKKLRILVVFSKEKDPVTCSFKEWNDQQPFKDRVILTDWEAGLNISPASQ